MLETAINKIDRFIDKQGRISSYLIYPLVIVVLYEVVMRYAFNSPTVWGFEVTAFAYGLHYMLGLSYTERHAGHVKVDIVTMKLSKKTQAVLGVITYGVIFVPVFFCMTAGAVRFAFTATMQHELNSTSWAPPIWPLKILMALSFLFLLLQGIASLLKHVRTLKS